MARICMAEIRMAESPAMMLMLRRTVILCTDRRNAKRVEKVSIYKAKLSICRPPRSTSSVHEIALQRAR